MQLPNNLIIECSYTYNQDEPIKGILLDLVHHNGLVFGIIMLESGKIVSISFCYITISNPDLLFKLSTV